MTSPTPEEALASELNAEAELWHEIGPSHHHVAERLRQAARAISSLSAEKETLARRAADAERERDNALARVTAYAKTLVKARQDLIWIRDELEDEGDRVYFGSTNHAETFRETVERFDEWVWDDTVRAAELPDVYGELASALSRLAALKEKCARLIGDAEDINYSDDETRIVTVRRLRELARAVNGEEKQEAGE